MLIFHRKNLAQKSGTKINWTRSAPITDPQNNERHEKILTPLHFSNKNFIQTTIYFLFFCVFFLLHMYALLKYKQCRSKCLSKSQSDFVKGECDFHQMAIVVEGMVFADILYTNFQWLVYNWNVQHCLFIVMAVRGCTVCP